MNGWIVQTKPPRRCCCDEYNIKKTIKKLWNSLEFGSWGDIIVIEFIIFVIPSHPIHDYGVLLYLYHTMVVYSFRCPN